MDNSESKFLSLVRKRFSVRQYRPDSVPREVIERCIEAARLAPSACNSQPWKFIVVEDSEVRKKLIKIAFGGIYQINKFVAQAPVIVIPVRKLKDWKVFWAGRLRKVAYPVIDLAIALEHFVLQAAEEGLGTCWIGWFDEQELIRWLRLSGGARIDVLITLGYPAEKAREKKRKTIKEILEYL